MGKRGRRRQAYRVRRFMRSHSLTPLALGTAVCSLLSAISGWSGQPTVSQAMAAACGCAIAAGMYVADRRSEAPSPLKKMPSICYAAF